jgi:ketosteroid isomerase-like protein
MSSLARRSVLVVLSEFTLIGCSPKPRAAAAAELSLPTVEAELQSIWNEYIAAVKAGDAGRVAALYADSIYFMETGAPTLRTRETLATFAAEALEGVRILDSKIVPEFTELRGAGVAQYGTYVDVVELPGQPPSRKYGRYAAIAERDSAGKWRLTRLAALVDSTPPFKADSAKP